MYSQRLPSRGLAIEEGTTSVPGDGRYYVLEHGVVRKSFRSLKQATLFYDRLKAPPEPAPDETPGVAAIS